MILNKKNKKASKKILNGNFLHLIYFKKCMSLYMFEITIFKVDMFYMLERTQENWQPLAVNCLHEDICLNCVRQIHFVVV